jgi:nucleoside-diphosphate-sugar epimerase
MHVVIGSGPVGSAIATQLAQRGRAVRVITRSGRGPQHPAIERAAVDASDASALREATRGAEVIYNAANPARYHTWPMLWPPLAAAMLDAAQAHHATLASVGNLYAYGPVDEPMRESMPPASTERKGRVRAAMWQDALAAHDAGRVRALEIRASDYLGADGNSHAGRAADLVVRGKKVSVIGNPDMPHTWTAPGDTARLAIAAAEDPAAHGRAWHVPSHAPRTQRELVSDLARVAGLPAPRVNGTPPWLIRAVGLAVPQMRELAAMTYQFDRPFVLDDSDARQHFGLEPTPWQDLLRDTVAAAHAAAGRKPPATSHP